MQPNTIAVAKNKASKKKMKIYSNVFVIHELSFRQGERSTDTELRCKPTETRSSIKNNIKFGLTVFQISGEILLGRWLG